MKTILSVLLSLIVWVIYNATGQNFTVAFLGGAITLAVITIHDKIM